MEPTQKAIYSLGTDENPERIIESVLQIYGLEEIETGAHVDHYYDTFDWRLYRKQLKFIASDRTYMLKTFSDKVAGSVPGESFTRLFWWDVSEQNFAEMLKKHLSMRALTRTVSIEYKARRYRVLNRDRKTVVYLTVKSGVSQCNERKMELPDTVEIESVRGYEKPYEKLVRLATDQGGELLESTHSLLERAYGIAERQPLDYGAKFEIALNKEQTIGAAVSLICQNLLDSMETNFSGVMDDIDSEFLHDYRIAIRRTRSLMSLMRKYLPQEELLHFQSEFKWLGSITGPLRDIDVYLLEKQDYLNLLPESLRGGLETFFQELVDKREAVLQNLRENLRSKRYEELKKSWLTFLTDEDSPLFRGKGEKNCYQAVNKIIAKRFNSLLRDGDLIDDNTPDYKLHELRIKGKKFRYLLEFYRSFYDRAEIERFLKTMKKLQDNLGDFNDLSVQMEMLETKLGQLRGRNLQTIRFAAALGGLITRLRNEHEIVRASFSETYQSFCTEDTRNRISQMVLPTKTSKKFTR